MAREPIPTWFFVLVVVRRGDQFLLVHEAKHGQLWYLPAGRVKEGETFLAAAQREVMEEAGVPVAIEGILRIEHEPTFRAGTRLRIFFLARPTDDTPPKRLPDQESLGAAWVGLAELNRYPLRSVEVREVLNYVAGGGTVYPLRLLQTEGALWQ